MSTVRTTTYDLLRREGLTTIFGNPGSNELPFLAGMPEDFRYVLGLHEGAVLGMADGYAMASGRPAFVNLHAAAGTGNAMGALTNAVAAHTPLVVTAGQQVRATLGVEPLLAIAEPAQLPRPLVKWSAEPASATDVPRTISQAVHTARLEPQGPVFVSVPYDDWAHEAGPDSEHLAAHAVTQAAWPSPAQVEELVAVLSAAQNPVLVVGGAVDAAEANGAAVALAERLRMPAWIAPSVSRCPFPTRHASFRGVLPAAVRGIATLLAGHDLVVVLGAPVFRYHQYDPGQYLPEGARLVHVTSDPAEATRAPMGTALVGDLRAVLEAVLERLPEADRPMPAARPVPELPEERPGALTPAEVFSVVDAATPDDVVYVKESTSTTGVFWDHVDIRHPRSFFFPAAGGLGFGMPAAVGAALARPERRVVALIGDGSAHYGITALWTAAAYRVPVVFVVLKNGTYAALKAFAGYMGLPDVPGLDIGGIDHCAIAEGYGVTATRVDDRAGLDKALREALAGDGPVLIEVPTASTNPFD
ncbi:benzoylformate decarboxylase [Geodermatophilus sp. SYSU D00697]